MHSNPMMPPMPPMVMNQGKLETYSNLTNFPGMPPMNGQRMDNKMRPPNSGMQGMDRDSRDMRPPVAPPQQYMNRDDSRQGGRKDDH